MSVLVGSSPVRYARNFPYYDGIMPYAFVPLYSYYAENYAGIIDAGLFPIITYIKYFTHVETAQFG